MPYDKPTPGRRFRFTRRMKQPKWFKAKPGEKGANEHGMVGRYTWSYDVDVTSVENRGDYLYFSYVPLSDNNGKFGYDRWYHDGAHQYGIIEMEDLGPTPKTAPTPWWYPRPGDRGYDLMC